MVSGAPPAGLHLLAPRWATTMQPGGSSPEAIWHTNTTTTTTTINHYTTATIGSQLLTKHDLLSKWLLKALSPPSESCTISLTRFCELVWPHKTLKGVETQDRFLSTFSGEICTTIHTNNRFWMSHASSAVQGKHASLPSFQRHWWNSYSGNLAISDPAFLSASAHLISETVSLWLGDVLSKRLLIVCVGRFWGVTLFIGFHLLLPVAIFTEFSNHPNWWLLSVTL